MAAIKTQPMSNTDYYYYAGETANFSEAGKCTDEITEMGSIWMKYVPNETFLPYMSIPGTHDTMAYTKTSIFQRQSQVMNLSSQLEAGIRFLDITILQRDKYKFIGNIMSTLETFLLDSPSEFLIMKISLESDKASPPISNKEQELLESFYCDWNHLLWVNAEQIPSIKELRGKIVLFKNFPVDIDNYNYGFAYKDPSKYNISDMNSLSISNTFSQKFDSICENIMKAHEQVLKFRKSYCPQEAKIALSFLNGTAALTAPYKVAQEMNMYLYEHLQEKAAKYKCIGIIVMDFPGPKLIQDIIHINELLTEKQLKDRILGNSDEQYPRRPSLVFNTTPYSEETLLSEIQYTLKEKYKKGYSRQSLPWRDNCWLDINDFFIPIKLEETSEGNIKRKQQHEVFQSLEQVLKQKKMEDPDHSIRVVLKANQGFGKTTQCEKLCYSWATGKGFSNWYDLIFMIKASEVEESSKIIDLLTCTLPIEYQTKTIQQLIEDILKNPSAKVLIVLDGFDELQSKRACSKEVHALVTNEICVTSDVVITTRPWCMHYIGNLKPIDVVLSIHSFSKDQVKHFANNYVRNVNQQSHDNELQAVFDFMNAVTKAQVWELAKVPLFCFFLCILLEEKPGEMPKKPAEIFTRIVVTIKEIYKNKYKDPSSSMKWKREIQKLAKLAFHKMLGEESSLSTTNSKYPVSVFSVNEMKSGYGVNIDDACAFGLINKHWEESATPLLYNSVVDQEQYSFIHFTFQEYLAAWFLYFAEDEFEHNLSLLINKKNIIKIGHLQGMFTFFFGLLGNGLSVESNVKIHMATQILKLVHSGNHWSNLDTHLKCLQACDYNSQIVHSLITTDLMLNFNNFYPRDKIQVENLSTLSCQINLPGNDIREIQDFLYQNKDELSRKVKFLILLFDSSPLSEEFSKDKEGLKIVTILAKLGVLVQEVTFDSFSLMREEAHELTKDLKQFTNLKALNMYSCSQCEHILPNVPDCILECSLQWCDLNKESLKAICPLLPNLQKLQKLSLNNNRQINDGIRYIFKFAPECLIELNLSECNLTSDDVYKVRSSYLKRLTSLKILNLNFNPQVNEGAVHVIKHVSSALEVLKLEDCGITVKESISLAKYLTRFQKLKDISMDWNKALEQGFCQVMKSVPLSIQSLSFSYCNISSEHTDRAAAHLCMLNNLNIINLSHNPHLSKGVGFLLAHLPECVQVVNLSNCGINKDRILEIKMNSAHLTALKHLYH